MKKSPFYVLGVMSGTSLDGIDLAYVKFEQTTNLTFKLLNTETVPYTNKWKALLKNAFTLNGEALVSLDANYGNLLGKIIAHFLVKNNITQLNLIASHGHTVFHNPKKKYTLQIGNGPEIAAITGIKTICNFRTQDVSLGGQGAPLVPIGDELLFNDYHYCLNLGGFSNISFKKNKMRLAYDICPVNSILNFYAANLNMDFDEGGKIAETGKINIALLEKLNNIEYYKQKAPKSLGFEFLIENIFPLINSFQLKTADILATAVEHMAIQIAQNIENSAKTKVLVTGGGAYNKFLLERFRQYSNANFFIPSKELIEFKEALIFALLGYLKNSNEINCLKSVTGARKNHSSGIIFNP